MPHCQWSVGHNRIPCKEPKTCPLEDGYFVEVLRKAFYGEVHPQQWTLPRIQKIIDMSFNGSIVSVDIDKTDISALFPVELDDQDLYGGWEERLDMWFRVGIFRVDKAFCRVIHSAYNNWIKRLAPPGYRSIKKRRV